MAAKKLFYSMGEVSEMFDVNPSLLRHWESKFDCLRPHKNKKGNRMFSPEDVEKLKQIYHLVKERGMTLDGANKVMKSSRKELSRDTELLERLQRIRSALVEVREELKAGDDEQLVDVSAAETADLVAEQAAAAERMSERAADDAVASTVAEDTAPEAGAAKPLAEEVVASAEEESAAAETGDTAPKRTKSKAAKRAEPKADGAEAATEDSAAEGPKKRVRRRKKGDDDNKELFPFYEQSLF